MRRDLLVLMGFLRGGKMYPAAVPIHGALTERSLKMVFDAAGEQERFLFPASSAPRSQAGGDELRHRGALTSWSGEPMPAGTRVSEVPDPGVVLSLIYERKGADAPLPVAVFAQTLRRFALRDPVLRAKFDQHVDEAGTFVPAWLSPEVRRQRSQEAFDAAMRVAREQGFAHAAPLLEGVRGASFAAAQVAIAVYEMRELGDDDSALKRLNEVVRVSPRQVAARMQRAALLMRDAGRRVEAATDYLAVLRECGRTDGDAPPREVRDAATGALWELCGEYRHARKLESALAVAKQDPERGFEMLSRYVHTHPCAWDGQMHLAVDRARAPALRPRGEAPLGRALALPRRREPALRLRPGARDDRPDRRGPPRAGIRGAPRADRRRHQEVGHVRPRAGRGRSVCRARARPPTSASRTTSRARSSCSSAACGRAASCRRRWCSTSCPATSRSCSCSSRSACRSSGARAWTAR
jgi:hypothetical protein